jgi:hypothetical protein
MERAAERLRRKADEYQAIGEEHTRKGETERYIYIALELALREVAAALEEEDADG